jgi:signal transduction histidine kinase
LYRVAMELLNNVVKHSGAGSASVSLKAIGREIELSVSDNGKGFDIKSNKANSGLGLKNITSRLKVINAEIRFEELQPGTRAVVKVIC